VTALWAAGLTLGLIGVGLLLGLGLVAETGMSPETALLGTTPGAIETMTAVALDVARQPALVLAMQIFRMVGAVLVGPPVVKALARPAAPPRGPVGESPLPRPPLGQ
ncbi:MAG: AbrB family transcriptional regulator, partial [Firmicutes bacterium]|nr:AbrB family transcriptional regulator [Bacillota bacterium]